MTPFSIFSIMLRPLLDSFDAVLDAALDPLKFFENPYWMVPSKKEPEE